MHSALYFPEDFTMPILGVMVTDILDGHVRPRRCVPNSVYVGNGFHEVLCRADHAFFAVFKAPAVCKQRHHYVASKLQGNNHRGAIVGDSTSTTTSTSASTTSTSASTNASASTTSPSPTIPSPSSPTGNVRVKRACRRK